MLKMAKMRGKRMREMTSILLAFSISLGRLNGVATNLESSDNSGRGKSDGGGSVVVADGGVCIVVVAAVFAAVFAVGGGVAGVVLKMGGVTGGLA